MISWQEVKRSAEEKEEEAASSLLCFFLTFPAAAAAVSVADVCDRYLKRSEWERES